MVLHKNRCTVATLFILALFFLSIFFYLFFFAAYTTTFNPPLSHHTDLYIQVHPSPLHSPPSPPPPQQPPPPPPPQQPPPPPQSSSTITAIQPHSPIATASHHESVSVTDTNKVDNAIPPFEDCDLYTGTWVEDQNYPIYQPGSCPYVDEAYDCKVNGRNDTHYTKWRWKPHDCDLPSQINNSNWRTSVSCVNGEST